MATAEMMEIQEYVRKTKIEVNRDDYRFGIVVTKVLGNPDRRRMKAIGICNCGQHTIAETNYYNTYHNMECENCHNDFFITAVHQRGKRFTIPYLHLHYRNSRGFKVDRVNLSIIYTGEEIIPVKENLRRTMQLDIPTSTIKIWRGEELEFDGAVGSRRGKVSEYFFKQMNIKDFQNFVSTDVTRDYFSLATRISYNANSKSGALEAWARLISPSYRYLQILASAGVTKVDRFYSANNRYHNTIKTDATKPHEILGVPKFMMDYIREDHSIDINTIQEMRKNLTNVDANRFREVMAIVKDEGTMRDLSNSLSSIMHLHLEHGYENLRKLTLYLFREVKLTQGIQTANEAVGYLRDYIRMSNALDLEFEKYPKSLKKAHDVVNVNYQLISRDTRIKNAFKKSVGKPNYQNLFYESKKENYAIVLPESPDDLVREGNELSHCVSSYANAVAEERCRIVFLRNIDNLNTPLVTIEVRGVNIRQAKGRSNKPVTDEQKNFIKKWAEEKELIENYY